MDAVAAILSDPQVWIAFLTLTALELVLGIDNIIFISILVDRLPKGERETARRIGLFLAMFMRVGLLLGLSWIVGMTAPMFTLIGTDIVALTDAQGHFTMRGLPSGSRLLLARHLGYVVESAPVDLTPRETQHVSLTLPKFVAMMDPVLVTARRTAALDRVGFNQRSRGASGYFLGPDRLKNMHPFYMTDILRLVPSLRIVNTPTGATVTSSRGVTSLSGSSGCVQYFVDDMPFTEMEPGDANSFISGSEIVAVEVYQPGLAPAQYIRGTGSCVTILLWTRFRIRG